MAVLRATVTGLLFLQTIQNVLHFQKADYTTADLSNLADDINANYMDTTMRAGLFSEFIWQNINVRRVDGGTDPSFNKAVSLVGTAGSGASASPSLAMVLRLSTAVIGRHGRGRIYYPCLGPACMNNGIVTPSCLTFYNSLASHILARYGVTGSSDFTLCISNRADPTEFHYVTSIAPRNTPGHQRRRTVGVGI